MTNIKTLRPAINLSQREAVILALVTTAKNLRTIADELPELEMFAELCRINAAANDKLADEVKASRPDGGDSLREALEKVRSDCEFVLAHGDDLGRLNTLTRMHREVSAALAAKDGG